MIAVLALTAALHAPVSPPADLPFGADKVKHFLVSAFVHSATYAAVRATAVPRSSAQTAAGVTTMVVGIWKERRDQRAGRPFSFPDLAWDAAGALAAAALLNGTR